MNTKDTTSVKDFALPFIMRPPHAKRLQITETPHRARPGYAGIHGNVDDTNKPLTPSINKDQTVEETMAGV